MRIKYIVPNKRTHIHAWKPNAQNSGTSSRADVIKIYLQICHVINIISFLIMIDNYNSFSNKYLCTNIEIT